MLLVARPGFEPRQTVPKTVVLPLYYRAIFISRLSLKTIALKRNANVRTFFNYANPETKKIKIFLSSGSFVTITYSE
jgi:hypothetical protein